MTHEQGGSHSWPQLSSINRRVHYGSRRYRADFKVAKAELTSAVGTLGLVGGAVIFVPILLILVAAVGSLGDSPATPAEVQRISEQEQLTGLCTIR